MWFLPAKLWYDLLNPLNRIQYPTMTKRLKYKYHRDGRLPAPEDGYIFVFGSNLGGLHGLGAALVAKRFFGAEQGVGKGLTGLSYAVATKDRFIRTLPLVDIRRNVNEFIEFTHSHPELKFFVTRLGCGLAGYRDTAIAPMFRGANSNCSFAEQWRPYLK